MIAADMVSGLPLLSLVLLLPLQTRDVVVYRLVTCGTVEEKIYRKQVCGPLDACMCTCMCEHCMCSFLAACALPRATHFLLLPKAAYS